MSTRNQQTNAQTAPKITKYHDFNESSTFDDIIKDLKQIKTDYKDNIRIYRMSRTLINNFKRNRKMLKHLFNMVKDLETVKLQASKIEDKTILSYNLNIIHNSDIMNLSTFFTTEYRLFNTKNEDENILNSWKVYKHIIDLLQNLKNKIVYSLNFPYHNINKVINDFNKLYVLHNDFKRVEVIVNGEVSNIIYVYY